MVPLMAYVIMLRIKDVSGSKFCTPSSVSSAPARVEMAGIEKKIKYKICRAYVCIYIACRLAHRIVICGVISY